MDSFDYVTVGHVTVDVLIGSDGTSVRRPGGAALYSALQAARLGLRTLIVTQGEPRELTGLLAPFRAELELLILPARHTTTLLTTGSGSGRRQRVLSWAGEMPADALPSGARIIQLAPVARETPPGLSPDASFVAITPQGLMRRWSGPEAEVLPAPLRRDDLPRRCDAIALSESEWLSCAEPLHATRRPGEAAASAVIAVTAGSEPTTVWLPDGAVLRATPPTIDHPVDDLGAGDVFAAAFFVALADGATPREAAELGNAAAAARIGGEGPGAIADRSAVQALLSPTPPAL